MVKWSWLPGQLATKKLHVKVKPLKLEGFRGEKIGDGKERMVILKMKWTGPRSGLVPFHRVSTCKGSYSGQKFLRKGEPVEWNDEFESTCSFFIDSRDKSFVPWDVLFSFLCGEDGKSGTKLVVLGNVSLNIAELASRMDSHNERKLPISLQIDGVTSEATLLVAVSFAEVRNSHDAPGIGQNSAKSDNKEGSFKKNRGLTASQNNNKKDKNLDDQGRSCDSGDSSVFDLDGLPGNESIGTIENSNAELGSGTALGSLPSSETGSHKVGLFSWKKRRLNFGLSRKKGEPLIEKTSASASASNNDGAEMNLIDSDQCSTVQKDESCIAGKWEVKEIVSRDGQAKLKANMFFASFDQRSEKAAGESACTALVAVIAHWLHSNKDSMPTISQFDGLITEGSLEWRKLCNNEVYKNSFPDNHFDLETVLRADLRPLTILHEQSFTGIFSPEKFENLKEATSFDDIWNEISSNKEDYDQRIYIVSWNDHFFVLKVDANAYYIIDSLGERLFEGCNQAYILKFDESTLMYGKEAKEEVGSEQIAGAQNARDENASEDITCKGKECCREFIKRFLAAIPVGELEEEEKKGTVSTFSLLHRLQIDFHYCSSSSASSSSSSLVSSTSSLLSCEGCIEL